MNKIAAVAVVILMLTAIVGCGKRNSDKAVTSSVEIENSIDASISSSSSSNSGLGVDASSSSVAEHEDSSFSNSKEIDEIQNQLKETEKLLSDLDDVTDTDFVLSN